jgi:hypothetical protein
VILPPRKSSPMLYFQKSRDLLRASYDYATSHHEDFIGQAGAGDPRRDRSPRREPRAGIGRTTVIPAAGPTGVRPPRVRAL